jgi:Ca2+-binding EF-hand superfamily protein
MEELRQLMHSMDPTMSEDDLIKLMKYIDVDEDGQLGTDEFRRIFRQFEFKNNE